MSRTSTMPPDDTNMWRKVLKRVHPDAGGDHDLFIWISSLKESVSNAQLSPPPPREPPPRPPAPQTEDRDSVEVDPALSFDEITESALAVNEYPYDEVLSLLRTCAGRGRRHKGATYKQLAAIAHRVGMSKSQRCRWYRVAEDVQLSRKHASHIMDSL
jgi:hypothetical protein